MCSQRARNSGRGPSPCGFRHLTERVAMQGTYWPPLSMARCIAAFPAMDTRRPSMALGAFVTFCSAVASWPIRLHSQQTHLQSMWAPACSRYVSSQPPPNMPFEPHGHRLTDNRSAGAYAHHLHMHVPSPQRGPAIDHMHEASRVHLGASQTADGPACALILRAKHITLSRAPAI